MLLMVLGRYHPAITLSGNGSKLFVTGMTTAATRPRPTGSVDVSPTGSRVFVTGQSQVPPDSLSYHPPRMDTIAYSG